MPKKKPPGEEPTLWEVVFHEEFVSKEWGAMDAEQRVALLAAAKALACVGPTGGRPLIGTLENGRHPNMKELRYDAHAGTQVWRAAFAFDPARHAVVLVAGEKQGRGEKAFYAKLLRRANDRFSDYLLANQAASQRRKK